MKKTMTDEEFWNLVDDYESHKIDIVEAIKQICSHTNSMSVALADFNLLTNRNPTKNEYIKFKEFLKQ